MIIALTGMPGAGKTEAAKILKEKGYYMIRLGDITFNEMRSRGLENTKENEEMLTQQLRKEHGPEAYVKLILGEIDKHENVVIDGLRNPAEFKFLREKFGHNLKLVHIDSTNETRYLRLENRQDRPHNREMSLKRDKHELNNLGVRQAIDMADVIIHNEGSLDDLKERVNKL